MCYSTACRSVMGRFLMVLVSISVFGVLSAPAQAQSDGASNGANDSTDGQSGNPDTNIPNRPDPNSEVPDPNVTPGDGGDTPLVLDWDRNGEIATFKALSDKYVAFDLRANQHPIRLEWIASSERFLTIDLNHNGQIDSGRELFGDATLLPDSMVKQSAAHGFLALAAYDSNGDGKINRHDLVWNKLLLWHDRNHDGKSTPDELTPLHSTDVVSLNLEYERTARPLEKSTSFIGLTATYTTIDGRHHLLADVYFRSNSMTTADNSSSNFLLRSK